MGYPNHLNDTLGMKLAKLGVDDWWFAYTFYYPDVPLTFSSPMVSPENLIVGSRDDAGTIRRVVKGRKPIGFTCSGRRAWAERVQRVGGVCTIRQATGGRALLLSATLGGVARDLFDLDALIADYTAIYADASADVMRSVEREVSRIAPMDLRDLCEFRKVDACWYGSDMPGSAARCGLLLGYPIESTAAMVRLYLGLPGGVLRNDEPA